MMLGGEKEDVGAKRGMCGIFAGCGPVTDGAEQGTCVAVCWLVTRCLAIESGTNCVTSYAQPFSRQQLCSATGGDDAASVRCTKARCFNAYCWSDLHRKRERARVQRRSTSRKTVRRGGIEKCPKQQNCLCRVSRIRKVRSCLFLGRRGGHS